MKTDTINFLEVLLFNGTDQDTEQGGVLYGKTVYDFTPAFTNAVDKFVSAFRDHLEQTGFPMEKLDASERSFGGNVYWSLSGAGVGFFDDNDEAIAGLHERLKTWAGEYRFEDLANMLDVGEDGKIDLSFIPSAIEEYREKYFGVPKGETTPPVEKEELQRCNHCEAVFSAERTACPECWRDDALMYPFEPEVKPLVHTQGPWKQEGRAVVGPSEDIEICVCTSDEEVPTGEAYANAKLIAAAPEMLDTLLTIEAMIGADPAFDTLPCNVRTAYQKALAAIAKAKGGQ